MSASSAASQVDELERRYLNGTFAELCRIESPSGRERRCADRVIAELRALGVAVAEDDVGERVGSDCGNLLAHLPARAGGEPLAPEGTERASAEPPCVLLCAHLDTVPLQAPVEPVLLDGRWENANEGILGADNKAAVAVMLALARHVRHHPAAVELELLFTVGEELALVGARAFDASRLRCDFGYVFDHPSPIGEVIVSSPTHFRVEATFVGAAAHAGIRPEDGRSAIVAAARAITAMRLGRVDGETTVNVGTISGGTAMNVVPERCTLVAEVRGHRDERAEAAVAGMLDRLNEAANLPECECDVDVSVQRTFCGYRIPAGKRALRTAERALRACGYEPSRVASAGGSDANALIAQGVEVLNLANGTERNHEPGERVSAAALEGMLDVSLALLDHAAGVAPHGAR